MAPIFKKNSHLKVCQSAESILESI